MRNAYIMARMVKAMFDGEFTKQELKNLLGIDAMTTSRYVHALHRERVIRIAEYRRGKRGQAVPAFTLNPDALPDAEKVSFAVPHNVVCKRSYDKKKAMALNRMFAGAA